MSQQLDHRQHATRGFRRDGLPVRANSSFVDRVGDIFVWQDGHQPVLEAVALVLALRRRIIRASGRDPSTLVRVGNMEHLWCCTATISRWFGRRYLRHGGRVKGWEIEGLTAAQSARRMAGYFKTHVFNVFGGQHWLRFLIAMGDVSEEAVEATNRVVNQLVRDKRNMDAMDKQQEATGHHYTRRNVRVPRADEKPKAKRKRAANMMRELEAEKAETPEWWNDPVKEQDFDRRVAEIEALHEEADRVSKAGA